MDQRSGAAPQKEPGVVQIRGTDHESGGTGKAEHNQIIEFIAGNVKEWGGKVKEK